MAKTSTICEFLLAVFLYYSSRNVFVHSKNVWYYIFFCCMSGCLMLYSSFSPAIEKLLKPTKGQTQDTKSSKHEIKIE